MGDPKSSSPKKRLRDLPPPLPPRPVVSQRTTAGGGEGPAVVRVMLDKHGMLVGGSLTSMLSTAPGRTPSNGFAFKVWPHGIECVKVGVCHTTMPWHRVLEVRHEGDL